MKILIVDDNRTSQHVLTSMLKSIGHDILNAFNGKEAVEVFLKANPDLILMDVLMPVMDGFDATRQIKKDCEGKFVPIIFLTGLDAPDAITKCIACGGDDFITKPYQPEVIEAKILAMERIGALHARLWQHQIELVQEHEVASHVLEVILNKGSLDGSYLSYKIEPVSRFCGDLLLCANSPIGGINFMLADFTGQGLSAAIGAIPVSDIFYSMTTKGFSVGDIAVEINLRLIQILPANMYCEAIFGEIDAERSTLALWNGAMPDVLLTNNKSEITHRVKSMYPALGTVSVDRFDRSMEVLAIADIDRIYMVTDGLLNIKNSQGEKFGQRHLETLIESNVNNMASVISNAAKQHLDGLKPSDDFTIVELKIPPVNNKPGVNKDQRQTSKVPSLWSVSLKLDALTLRDINAVPIILNLIMDVQAPLGHRERLFTVISELYNNALDHGVLGLDSEMKKDSDGFIAYYEAREHRLSNLTDASIEIHLDHIPRNEGGRLAIKIIDSGPGFDYQVLQKNMDSNKSFGGRGLALVSSLCLEMTFLEKGNSVVALYDWSIKDNSL